MIYSTDELTLTRISRDSYGAESQTVTTAIPCRIEQTDRVMDGLAKGQTVKASTMIIVPAPFAGKKGDRVTVTKQWGATPADAREQQIIEVFPIGAFSGPVQYEVYT